MLMKFLNYDENAEEAFLGKISTMSLQGTEEDVDTMRKAIYDRFLVHYREYVEGQTKVYDELLDEGVLDAAIAFYTSDEGAVIVEQLPKISQAIEKLCFRLNKSVMRDLMNVIEEYSADEESDTGSFN